MYRRQTVRRGKLPSSDHSIPGPSIFPAACRYFSTRLGPFSRQKPKTDAAPSDVCPAKADEAGQTCPFRKQTSSSTRLLSKVIRVSLFIPIFFALLFSGSTKAIVGNISGVPCLIACGGDRGIFNTRFFGDAAQMYLFEPSIDKLGEKLDGLGAKYSGILDSLLNDKIKSIDAVLQNRLSDLEKILAGQVDKLGHIADVKIAKLAEVLSSASQEAQGRMDDTLKVALHDLETQEILYVNQLIAGLGSVMSIKLLRTLFLATVFLGIVLTSVGIFLFLSSRRQSWHKTIKLMGGGAVICVALGIVGKILLSSEEAAAIRPLKAAFDSASKSGDVNKGLAIAVRYAEFESSDATFANHIEKLSILRKYFFSPTSFRLAGGFKGYIGELAQFLNRSADTSNNIDPIVGVILAELLATHGEDRRAHYLAAQLAYQAVLSDLQEKGGTNYFGIDPRSTALYLLRAYLLHPFHDRSVRQFMGESPLALIGLRQKIPNVTLDKMSLMADELEKRVTLTSDQKFKLTVRGLILRSHVAYSSILAAIFNHSYDAGGDFNFDFSNSALASAMAQAKTVLGDWEAVTKGRDYANASPSTRRSLLAAPFAVIERLQNFNAAYMEDENFNMRLYCGGRFAAFNTGVALFDILSHKKKVFAEPQFLEQTVASLVKDGSLSSRESAVIYVVQRERRNTNSEKLLLEVENPLRFSLLPKTRAGEPIDNYCTLYPLNGSKRSYGITDFPIESWAEMSSAEVAEYVKNGYQAAGKAALFKCSATANICRSSPQYWTASIYDMRKVETEDTPDVSGAYDAAVEGAETSLLSNVF